MLAITKVIIQLAFQRTLDHHLGQLAQQPALAGQLQPARAGPLGKLPQQLLISGRELRPVLVLATRHVYHWCLLRLWSYTVKITVPQVRPSSRRLCTLAWKVPAGSGGRLVNQIRTYRPRAGVVS